ncbi:AbrB family transcriptional regulator [Pararhodobacter sp.]|uniref:AbrB family transcriptional regulator n=1 Tax=Pararhodobacter sp. TaxID=2127056 RepID=UPI002FDCB705
MQLSADRVARQALVYAGAIGCGWIGSLINLPLPWMIGALVFATGLSLSGVVVRVPQITRPVGQIVIAGSVGLAFTAAALESVVQMFIPMVLAALATLIAGFFVAWVLTRLAGVDAVTASLASIPMGPVESANLARHYGVSPGPVIFTQTLRIMALILLIPPVVLYFNGGLGGADNALRSLHWTAPGATLLIALAVAGAYLMKLVRLSNPFFLGPLAASAVASAVGLPVTSVPYWMLAGAQVLLGVWLGAAMDRTLFQRAGGFVAAAVASTLLMIALCVAMALAMAAATGFSWSTMVLAFAPGSVTEMALTAKLLHADIALVTAFHLVRIFIILPTAPLFTRWVALLVK